MPSPEVLHSDVLIVGAGPAGSSLAWALRNQGLSVRVLDKQRFPRDKICAGWVTPAVMASLQINLKDYSMGRTLQAIKGFRVGMMGQPIVEHDYGEEVVSYGIRRCEFDHYLLSRLNCDVDTDVSVSSIRREGPTWRVNERFSSDLLVGAGGHFCPVARSLGAKLGQSEQVVAAKEVEFEMTTKQAQSCPVRAEIPELYFCKDLLGYAWVFRKGNFLNIGLGREDNHQLREHLEAFVKQLQSLRRIPAELPSRFKGHAYILYNHGQRQCVAKAALLVGDAAGLAYMQSGEGIRPAVESALMAARIIGDAQGDYSEPVLKSYQECLQKRFGHRKEQRFLNFELPTGIKQGAARVLMRSPWFIRYMVTERWLLHRQQAPLLA
jgi:geranylgeranyl reductase family protein